MTTESKKTLFRKRTSRLFWVDLTLTEPTPEEDFEADSSTEVAVSNSRPVRSVSNLAQPLERKPWVLHVIKER